MKCAEMLLLRFWMPQGAVFPIPPGPAARALPFLALCNNRRVVASSIVGAVQHAALRGIIDDAG